MKKEQLLPMNLQFFSEEGEADVASDEAAEIVEPQEGSHPEGGEEGEVSTETAEVAEPQSPEMNAVYANMRRKAEAEAQRQAQSQMQELDAMYAQAFGQYTNPVTGQPIKSAKDYMQAMEAQKRQQANEKLQEAGVDPSIIDQAIASSPMMQQAQQALRENQEIRVNQQLQEDLKAIMKIDPSIRNENDLYASENIMQAIQMVNDYGVTLADAYKLVNFERLSAQNTEAAKQQAINQSRSKDHLTTAAGVQKEDKSVDIPAGMLSDWREAFPDKSDEELRKLYNKALSAKGG